jgi:hypothetical protein
MKSDTPEQSVSADEIHGSRFRRAAKLGGAAAGVAAREASARAMLAAAPAPRASS